MIHNFRRQNPLITLVMSGVVVLLILLGVKSQTPQFSSDTYAAADKDSIKIRGSIPYWDSESAFTSFRNNADLFYSVSLFWYYLSENGEITTYNYATSVQPIIEFAHSKHVKVFATLTNLPDDEAADWDSKRVVETISSPDKRQKHIQAILTLLNTYDYDGITVDYESVEPNARDSFSEFVQELSQAAHAQGKIVGVALHPRTGDFGQRDGYRYQDWPALAKSADELYIMAYGEHWDTGSAGPIASYPWTRRIITYVERQSIPKQKIYLGTPLYGLKWQTGTDKPASGLVYSEVDAIIKKYSAVKKWSTPAREPYLTYRDNDTTFEVWYEDAVSTLQKYNLAKKSALGGISLWRLGGEDPSIWQSLRNANGSLH